jgi:hypothetical protein
MARQRVSVSDRKIRIREELPRLLLVLGPFKA